MEHQNFVRKTKKVGLAISVIALVLVIICGVFIQILNNAGEENREPIMSIKILDISSTETAKEEQTEVTTTRIKGQEGTKLTAKHTVDGKVYINHENTVTLELTGTDETKYDSSNLKQSDIVVKVGGEDVTSQTTVNLSAKNETSSGVTHTLTLSNIPGNGLLTIELAANTLSDAAQNKNALTFFDENDPNFQEIYLDNSAPAIDSVVANIDNASSLTINIKANDAGPSGIKGCYVYRANGTTLLKSDETGSGDVSITISSTVWRNEDLKIKTNDLVGNEVTADIDYYTVKDVSGLKGLSTSVNSTSGASFENRIVKQIADIDLTNTSFTPIGTQPTWSSTGNATVGIFKGTYTAYDETNDKNFKIFNLNSTDQNAIYAGLFGYAYGANISNIDLVNATVSLSTTTNNFTYAAGIAGIADNSTISNCTVSGNIFNQSITNNNSPADNPEDDMSVFAAGIVGYGSNTTITNCINSANVTSGNSTKDDYAGTRSKVGGIVGNIAGSNSLVDSCTNSGTITGRLTVGGIAGQAGGTIKMCQNTGDVSNQSGNSTDTTDVGGIVGFLTGTLKGCDNTATITANKAYNGYNACVGGIVGTNSNGTIDRNVDGETITINTNSGSIVCKEGKYAGGIVGDNRKGIINYSNNSGTVTSDNTNTSDNSNSNFGGIAGINVAGSIANCTNNGGITAINGIYIGGIVGENKSSLLMGETPYDGDARIENCNNYATVEGLAYVGGIAGGNNINDFTSSYPYTASIVNCNCKAFVKFSTKTSSQSYSDTNKFIGGIVGENGLIHEYYNKSKIEKCIFEDVLPSRGQFSMGSGVDGLYRGGIAGANSNGLITECANKAMINLGSSTYVGGIVGNNYSGTVQYCYCKPSNNYLTGSTPVGGIIGNVVGGTIQYCYTSLDRVRNSTTYNTLGEFGSGTVTEVWGVGSSGARNKTKEDIKTLPTLTIWKSHFKADSNNINGGFPIFTWE